MSRIKEAGLLQNIKNIYGQYSSVDCFVFTTFDFDPDFFANHLVSELMGKEHGKISTISELNAANSWIKKNHVTVYYDISGLRDNVNTILTIPVCPVYIETGVFHPKVIALFGTAAGGRGRKLSHLIVSSANLTVSGYARNIECFSAIEVTSRNVADSLSDFLKSLKKMSDKTTASDLNSFIDYLKYSRFKRDESIEFFWNMEDAGRKEKWLKTKLAQIQGGDVQIISPYYDKRGPGELISDLTDGNMTIYPSKDGNNYNIKRKDYRLLKKLGVKFAEIDNNDKGHIRFIHAKIIRKGSYIVEGSYNFTEAALCGRNAEAALVFNSCRGKLDLQEYEVDPRLFLNDEDIVDSQDTAESWQRIFIYLTVDWRERIIHIECELSDGKEYYIRIGNVTLDWNRNSNLVYIDNRQLEDALLRNKSFILYRDGEQVYCGRFNELNWTEDRPEIACKNLGEAVLEWFNADKRDAGVHTSEYDVRVISAEDETVDVLFRAEKSDTDIFDNYFYLASAMSGLLKKLREAGDNRTRYKIFSTSPGSMRRILDFAYDKLGENDIDPAYFWLLFRFLNKAYDRLPESAVQISNYNLEKDEFKRKLDCSIEKCRIMILNASSKGNGSIEKFLEWIDKEFDEN